MQYGFSTPMRGPLANFNDISNIVRAGEQLGFTTVAVSDHIVVPTKIDSIYPYNESGEYEGRVSGEYLEQLTTASVIAALTSKLRILTSVTILPYRNPVLTAKILATIDVLSNGRLTVGCGTGWMKEEFEAMKAPTFEERGSVSDEHITIFRELWTNDHPTYKSNYYEFHDISFLPKPIQNPHPPIWIGGESAPALKRAAAFGDCWYPIGSNPRFPLNTPALLGKRVKRLHELAEDIGRDPSTIGLACGINWMDLNQEIKKNDGSRKTFTGSKEQIADDIGCLKELGIHYLSLNFPGTTTESIINEMASFMNDVVTLVE